MNGLTESCEPQPKDPESPIPSAHPHEATPQGTVIIVTGMQRSATSMVCQLLDKLGESFGDPSAMIPGDRWNPGGYYETREVMDINSMIITSILRHGSRFGTWLGKVAYVCMPAQAGMAARADRQRAAIADLGERYRSCVIKDPRFCLTLRYWRQWTNVDKIVVCIRHAAAVVDSLSRRHNMPRWLGARFYAYHVDALIEQLPPDSVLFVDVDRLTSGEPDELDALRRGLGLNDGPDSQTLLNDILRPDATIDWTDEGHPCPKLATAAWHRLKAVATQRRETSNVVAPS